MRHKIIEDATQGHKKKQIWIALNINELELLRGMASKLATDLPNTGPTARLQHVAQEMNKTMSKSISELTKLGIEEFSELRYPHDEKSVI